MADVYLAVSRVTPGFERLAVIKRLRADLLVDDDENPQDAAHFVAMFRDEARLAILLKHANIVHTYDVFEDEDKLYLVMEYIEGQSLTTVARELAKEGRRLTPEHAAVVTAEILAGLHYAHELKDYAGEPLNIVHRDVSPQNVLLGYDGSIKLVDFGVAKVSFRTTQTRAGTMKGKARYMAPEQVVNKNVDRRADVYSAGVMLWELLAGKKLVSGANMFEQLVNVLKTPPPRLSSVVPEIDPRLDAIVAKALEREPDDRFTTAQDMRDALLEFLGRGGAARPEDVGNLVSEVCRAQRERTAAVIKERMATEGTPSETRPADTNEAAFVELDEADARGIFSDRSISGSRPVDPASGSGSGSTSVPMLAGTSSTSTMPSAGTSEKPARVPSGQPPASAPASVTSPSPGAEAPPPNKSRPTALVVAAVLLLGAGVVVGGSLARGGGKSGPPAGGEAAGDLPAARTSIGPAPTAAPTTPPTPTAVAPVPTTSTAITATTPPPAPEPPRDVTVRRAPPQPAAPPARVAPATPAVAAPPPTTKSADGPPPSSAVEAPGFLTIDTYPWTKVSVDGRPVGSTPVVRVSLPPGTHTVVMENPGENVRESTTVTIKSGETVSKRLAFDK